MTSEACELTSPVLLSSKRFTAWYVPARIVSYGLDDSGASW